MKLTVDRLENNIAFCEYTDDNGDILYTEIPISEIPFEVCEGTVFTMIQTDNGCSYVLSADDPEEVAKRKKRVRSKLNMLFRKNK